jgi:penicillin-binding protein 1C
MIDKSKGIRTCLIITLLVAVLFLALRITPYRELDSFVKRAYSTVFYDRNGVLLQVTPLEGGLRREFVPLDALKNEIAAVFIEAEDSRFYYHYGVDLISIARAGLQNIRGGRRISGASTITMQLARIIAVQSGAAYSGAFSRKFFEALNALRLESRLSKKEILELYLNSTPFGFQTEGIASAARNFFSTEVDMLSPAQIFCLAVIPRRPALYNPIDNPAECKNAAENLQKKFSASVFNRKKYSLLASINDEDWDFTVRNAKRFNYPFEMPHLIRYVMSVEAPSPQITLCADINVQRYIENLIAQNVERYRQQRLNNGAAVMFDNKNGDVLAWVGSADFDSDDDSGQIDGVQALNQPGSSMKPFLYALALEKGIKPGAVLADVPVKYGSDEIYIPQNFNNRFYGPVLLRHALASSLNIPAVELLYRLSLKEYADFLHSLRFESLSREGGAQEAGLGLALGNAPVSIFELARAFSIFPNDGKQLTPRFTISPNTVDDTVDDIKDKKNIIRPDTARIISSFLSDREARYLAFGQARNFTADFPMIVKTGTANQYQSIVALAATRRFSVAVWMGNFSGATVIGKTGSSVPAAIARDTLVFSQKLFSNGTQTRRSDSFEEPENFIKMPVCALSGLAPGEACRTLVSEYVEKSSALPPCDWHRIENGAVAVRYPAEYQSWLLASRRGGTISHAAAELSILTPRDGFVFFMPENAGRHDSIPVEVIGGQTDELRVDYEGSSRIVRRPFKFFLPLNRGAHTLSVSNGSESDTIQFSVE